MGSSVNKVLVTGGAGFIGSHLVEKLVGLGYETRVLDNFSSGKKENLAEVINDVELIYGDVRDSNTVAEAVHGVDAVIHLAALIDVHESLEKPLLYNDVNSTGTLNILDSIKSSGKKLIFISSCAVYGNPVALPVGEDHRVNPLSPYAASKLSAEGYCQAYSGSFGCNITVFRLFNVYGPRQGGNQYAGVVSIFMKKARLGEPLIIFGDGEQTRDFVFVGDVVEFIARAVEREAGEACGTFNVGSGGSVSIEQLAGLVLKAVDQEQSAMQMHVKARHGDILHSRADISKAVKAFDFTPRMTLEDGLRKIINGNNN